MEQLISFSGKWQRFDNAELKQTDPVTVPNIPDGTNNYIETRYMCPICFRNLVKLSTPTISLPEEGHTANMIYTCAACHRLFIPLTDELLDGFYTKELYPDDYADITTRLDAVAR